MEQQTKTNNSERKYSATKMSLPIVYNKENGLPYVMRMYRDASYVLLRNGQKPLFNRRPSEDMPKEENLAFLGWVGVEIGHLALRFWMDDLCSAVPQMTVQDVKDAFRELRTAGVVFQKTNKVPLVRFSVYEHLVNDSKVFCFMSSLDSDVWVNVTSNSSEDLSTVIEFLHQMQVYGLCKNFRFEVDGGDEVLGEKVKQELEAIYGPKVLAN